MNWHLIQTADGSPSLFVPELNETYHSRHGARTESAYVYIQQGLEQLSGSQHRVLEIGFGTGLNAWLAFSACQQQGHSLHYTTLEPYPLPQEVVGQLGYVSPDEPGYALWPSLHQAPWEQEVELGSGLTLIKRQTLLEDLALPAESFDLIFFDAFAPNKQPDLWQVDRLSQCYQALKPGGLWVSYCAQGQVRRDLQSLGFVVERLPGPPYKKEMLRARKPV